MKKCLAVLLALLLCAALCGCDRSMNWVICNEPSVKGTVEAVDENWVTLRVERVYDLTGVELEGRQVILARATRLNDCKFISQVGDTVRGYFEAESLRLGDGSAEITAVHGYINDP